MLANLKLRKRSKNNKRGVILVTVLFIFAISVIFLSCALMMTGNTRTRMYDRAKENQARLTVTSAAEAFYQALTTQTISDDWLTTAVEGDPIIISATDSAGNFLPGMSNNDANNMTTMTIDRSNCPAGVDVTVIFETIIGAGENPGEDMVVLNLKYNPPTANHPGFEGMVDTASMNGAELSVGGGDGSDSDDNIVYVRGDLDYRQGQSNSGVSSTFVITGNFIPHGGFDANTYVLWGDNAVLDLTAQGANGLSANGLYFVNGSNNGHSMINSPSTSYSINVGTAGFVNANLIGSESVIQGIGNAANILSYSATQSPSGGYSFNWNGNTFTIQQNGGNNAATNVTNARNRVNDTYSRIGSLSDQVADLQHYLSGEVISQITRFNSDGSYETAEQAVNDGVIGVSTTPSGTSISITDLNSAFLTGNISFLPTPEPTPTPAPGEPTPAPPPPPPPHSFPAGNYIIPGGTIGTGGSNDEFICIDLTGGGSCTWYVTGDLEFKGARILVISDDKDSFFRIILSNGANLTFTTANSGIVSGIYSASTRSVTDVVGAGANTLPTNTSSTKPHCMIFGLSDNIVTLNRFTVLDAYIGLFDSQYTSTSSSVVFSDTSINYFGRIMSPDVHNGNGLGQEIPYCPGPNYDDGSIGLTILTSNYSVVGFEYYY